MVVVGHRCTAAEAAAYKRASPLKRANGGSLNVPKRTLESWEQGRRTPKAGEARLLQIVEAAPKEFEALVFAVGKDSAKRKRRKRSAVA
jgi:hypothetical protein